MKIALTYDLRDDYRAEGFSEDDVAEFDSVGTIEALDQTLRALGHTTDRVGHARSLVKRLARGDRWDLAFNIAEGVFGFGRESQVPCILDAYAIPYVFSDPLTCALTLHKGMAKRVLRDMGVPTPDFAIVESLADAERISPKDMPFPLFAKPIAEGTSKGVGRDAKISNKDQLMGLCKRLLDQFQQPVLVERFLPGREFTVGLLGTGEKARAVAVMEVNFLGTAEPEIYTYLNKEECETRIHYSVIDGPLADEASELALRAWKALGCRDGGRIDVRANPEGRLEVLEANPLPGLHPQHSDLPIMSSLKGLAYKDLIAEIVGSAIERAQWLRQQWGEKGRRLCNS